MGLKNDKLIHFKAKLFTVDVSAKTQGHCRDLHGQQEQIQTAEVWGQGHQKCENWTPGLWQGIGCSLLLPLSCIGFQVKFLLKDRWREFMEKRRTLGGWKKQNLSHKKNVRNLAKWTFRCLLRWDNLTDNLKPIYLFLFSSPILTVWRNFDEIQVVALGLGSPRVQCERQCLSQRVIQAGATPCIRPRRGLVSPNSYMT